MVNVIVSFDSSLNIYQLYIQAIADIYGDSSYILSIWQHSKLKMIYVHFIKTYNPTEAKML